MESKSRTQVPKQKQAPVRINLGKVNIEADGDLTEITITKFDQVISLTREQAWSLADVILKKYGKAQP
jgi:hypothetical protein